MLSLFTMAAGWFLFTYAINQVVDREVITDWIIGIGYILVIDQIVFEILKFIIKRYR